MPRSPTTRFIITALAGALLAAPLTVNAQTAADYDYENLTFSGVGGHVVFLTPSRSKAAVGFNVRADLGLLGPNLRIAPGLTYWASEFRDGEVERMERRIETSCERGGAPCPGIELGSIGISDLSFDLDGHYLWTTDYGIEPYAGAGVSLHLLNGSGDFIDDTFVEELLDQIAPGLNVMAGLEMPLAGNLRLLGEARGTLTGTVRTFSLSAGGSYSFPAELRRPVVPPPPAAPQGDR